MVAQQAEDFIVEPRLMTELERGAAVRRQQPEKFAQPGRVLLQIRRQLKQKRPQPPHQHADEEFQYVIEGEGTWSLNGKEQPLKAGDLMYTRPWDWHGIRNSGDRPLRFVVFKYRPRTTPAGSR